MIVINNTMTVFTGGVIIGGIVLWYGSGSAVPLGYAICNGSGGRVNLMGKMVRGATSGADLLATGGSTEHLHAGAGSSSESHNHSFSFTTSGEDSYSTTFTGTAYYSPYQHTHSASGNTSSESHDHSSDGTSGLGSSLPSHKRLYWIQRIT